MIATSLALGWRLTVIGLAGVAGGAVNGIAGGGTFITFPTLLALGVPALQANVTTTVGVVPSYLPGLRGVRATVAAHRARLGALLAPCLLGAAAGCTLLLVFSAGSFRDVVPWLIGAATVLFAVSPVVTRLLGAVATDHPVRRRLLSVGVFVAAVYGGYFGAGMGIILFAVLALSVPLPIHELQVLRNLLSIVINSVAALIFVVRGHLALSAVWMLLAGTLVGGWLGTVLVRRLSPTLVRVLVVAIGVATTVRLSFGG